MYNDVGSGLAFILLQMDVEIKFKASPFQFSLGNIWSLAKSIL